MKDVPGSMERALDLIHQGVSMRFELWYSEVLFSWRWWFGFTISVASWGTWWVLHKRESAFRLLLAGIFVMLISVSLDAVGMQLKLWNYPYPIFPIIPAYLPYDLALLPVTIMLVIQIKPKTNVFLKAILFSLSAAYIGGTLFEWLGLYDSLRWRQSYSVPVYSVIYLIAHWLTNQNRNQPL